MFNKVDPLFKNLFRHAENADARLAMARKDPTIARKKDEDDAKNNKSTLLTEDETDVSIDALRSFLQSLLGAKSAAFNQTAQEAPPPKKAPDQKSAYAMNAYQTMAGEEYESVNITETPAQTEDTSNDFTINEDDRPIVEQLLNDLDALETLEVEYLVISRRGTFFESVKDAIQGAHDRFNL